MKELLKSVKNFKSLKNLKRLLVQRNIYQNTKPQLIYELELLSSSRDVDALSHVFFKRDKKIFKLNA